MASTSYAPRLKSTRVQPANWGWEQLVLAFFFILKGFQKLTTPLAILGALLP